MKAAAFYFHICVGTVWGLIKLSLSHTFHCWSILGCVLPLQEVALRQSPPTVCYPCSYRSLLSHNVTSPTTFWSSNWSHALFLPFCASRGPSFGCCVLPITISRWLYFELCHWFFAQCWCHGFCLSSFKHFSSFSPLFAGLFQDSLHMLLLVVWLGIRMSLLHTNTQIPIQTFSSILVLFDMFWVTCGSVIRSA